MAAMQCRVRLGGCAPREVAARSTDDVPQGCVTAVIRLRLSHKSATAACGSEILQPTSDVLPIADDYVASLGCGRRHVRVDVGDFSNVRDLCDGLASKQQRREVVVR